ncbi:unnamed protein product, partial [Allacma fusca]
MDNEFSGVRRSQRLLGHPPEIPTTPFPGLQRLEFNNMESLATATGQTNLTSSSETTSARSV